MWRSAPRLPGGSVYDIDVGRLTIGIVLAMVAAGAGGDDGGMYLSGAPKLLTSHPTVSMRWENVTIHADRKWLTVRCDFDFVNHGKACLVRMGFPDDSEGAFNPGERGDPAPKHLESNLAGFRSYVDGRRVRTVLLHGDAGDGIVDWQVKTVRFGSGQERHIREEYYVPCGIEAAGGPGYSYIAYYVLSTGSTWHGPIGDVTVTVEIDPKSAPGRLVPLDRSNYDWSNHPRLGKGGEPLLWGGPCKPVLRGHTLVFHVRNLKPTPNDNVYVTYGFTKNT